MTGSPTITFASLRYEVDNIEQLIADVPNIDSFVFAYYFSGTSSALQLAAYAHVEEPNHYHVGYEILPIYDDEDPLVISGPLKMCDNIVSLADMQKLIGGTGEEDPDFLIFTPNVNRENYIYYKITVYQNGVGSGKPKRIHLGDDGDVDTNPSPPAT
jgi:hypothetical protein